MGKPTIQELIRALDQLEIAIYERVSVPGRERGRWVRKGVRGAYDPESDRVRIGRKYHRAWSGADEMVATTIHEALHSARPSWPERLVRQLEMHYYKSRALRERAAVRLLNVLVFGNGWEEKVPPDEARE